MKNILIKLPVEVQERITKEVEKELEKQLSRLVGLTIEDKVYSLKKEIGLIYAGGESKLYFSADRYKKLLDEKDKKIAELTEIIQKRAI